MKNLKLIALLAVVAITLSNCFHVEETESIILDCCNDTYTHTLVLSFQDASGNDLLKHLGESELYSLKTVFEDGIPNHYAIPVVNLWSPWTETRETMYNYPYSADYVCFEIRAYSYKDIFDVKGNLYQENPFAEKITFKLKCPYLFEDDATHDIVTWWELVVEGRYMTEEEIIARNAVGIYEVGQYYEYKYPKCYRMEFGGKEFTVTDGYIATIVLDK